MPLHFPVSQPPLHPLFALPPFVMLAHLPSIPPFFAATHDWQAFVQVALQQTPSTQLPDEQSAPVNVALQEAPSICLVRHVPPMTVVSQNAVP